MSTTFLDLACPFVCLVAGGFPGFPLLGSSALSVDAGGVIFHLMRVGGALRKLGGASGAFRGIGGWSRMR